MQIKKVIALNCAVAVASAAAVSGYFQRSVWRSLSGSSVAAQTNQQGPAQVVQLWHCGMHPQVIQDHPGFCPICHMALTPMSAGHHITHGAGQGGGQGDGQGGINVTIDPTVVQNMGLRTATATRGPLEVSVQTEGVLTIPEPAIFEIVAQTNGWITQLNADTEGMHVHQGDVLFKYYSPDVHEAEAELIAAVKAFNLTKSDWVTTRRKAAQLVVDAAWRKCRGLGLEDDDIDLVSSSLMIPETVSFRSPASGAIAEKTVVQGSAIWSGMKIMRVEKHTELWLNAEVFENQMSSLAVGDEISATFDAVPGRVFTGKVAFLYPHVEAMSRAEMVRIVFPNSDLVLKPGMYATVTIKTRAASDAVLVPQEAVIDTGLKQLVFVALPDGHFDAREVRMGLRGDDDQVQILLGINEGDSVVTSGQFLLDVESRTQEAIEKMRSGGSAGSSPMPMPMPMPSAPMSTRISAPSASMPMPASPMNEPPKAAPPMAPADEMVHPMSMTAGKGGMP